MTNISANLIELNCTCQFNSLQYVMHDDRFGLILK